MDSHICDQLIFVKGVKVFQWKKESFQQLMLGKVYIPMRGDLWPLSHTVHKNNPEFTWKKKIWKKQNIEKSDCAKE